MMLKIPRVQKNGLALAALLLALVAMPRDGHAQCENPGIATVATQALAAAQTLNINQYLQQEVNFTTYKLNQTATKEVMDRFEQFRVNMLDALNKYAETILPPMRDQAKQTSVIDVDQTRAIGPMIDSQIMTETINRKNVMENEVSMEFEPAVSSCVLDNIATQQLKGARIARAVAGGIGRESDKIRAVQKGSTGARGPLATNAKLAAEQLTKYCDPDRGDQGCKTKGPLAGRNNDFGELVWGEKQTIDAGDSESIEVTRAVVNNLVNPYTPAPIRPDMVLSAGGKEAMMHRRANRARLNTVYNAVGQMIGERMGGTGANTQDLRVAAGVPQEKTSTDSSYREISEAITRDRFSDPEYLFNIANAPATLVRELGAINAVRMTQLSDIYKRTEELVWMEGALLGDMLDDRRGSPAGARR